MKKVVLFLFLSLLFLASCSSLTFVPTPPKATIATTDYVNQSMQKQVDETTQKVIEQTKNILDEMQAAERAELETLRTALENQQKNVQIVLSKMEEIDAVALQMRNIVGTMKKDLNDTKKEMLDSIDVVWASVGNLEKTNQAIKASITQLETNIDKLKQIDAEFTALTNQMNNQIDALPKETLMKLQEAIGKFYEGQNFTPPIK